MTSFARVRSHLLGVIACLALLASPVAHADFVGTGFAVGSQQFGVTGGTVNAGGYKGIWDGTKITFFCVELTQTFSFGTHYTSYTETHVINSLLNKLLGSAGSSALSDTAHSAAFQLAIWEVIYDSSDLHLDAGAFKVLNDHGNGATVALAQSFLDGLAGGHTGASWLTFLTDPSHQDFLRIPEPTTVLLIAVALLAAGFVRARSARTAA
jgi:hypothetical protein